MDPELAVRILGPNRFMANGWFWRSVTGLTSVQTAGISHLTGTAGMSVIYKTCRRKVGV